MASQMPQGAATDVNAACALAVVADDQTGQRTAERLRRAGLRAATVEPSALAAPVAGTLYLAPANRLARDNLRGALAGGAHVCLVPPWLSDPLAILPQNTEGKLTLAPVMDASGVALTPALEQALAGATTHHMLRILYRDQLVGILSQPLAATAAGEVVLATLPRTSNRHGQLLATTLLLGMPSAQTMLADVAILLEALLAWLGRVPVDHSPVGVVMTSATEEDVGDGERWAQIALLALALTLQEALSSDQAITLGPDSSATIHATFHELARRLGKPAAGGAFEGGWQTLVALGVVAADPAEVRPAALRNYLGHWQLATRLRRLRQPASGGR